MVGQWAADLVVVDIVFADVGVVHSNDSNSGILFRVHNDFPVKLGNRELFGTILSVQIDVHIAAIDILEPADSVCAGVDDGVKVVCLYKISGIVFNVEPVVTVEGFPLRGSIVEVICGILVEREKGGSQVNTAHLSILPVESSR